MGYRTMKKQHYIGLIAGLFLIAATFSLVYALLPEDIPDPQTLDQQTIVETLSQVELQTPEQRQAYAQALRDNQIDRRQMRELAEQLPEAQREQLRHNMRAVSRQARQARLDAYFELETEAEKTAYLDQMIEQIQQRMTERASQPKQERSRRGNGPSFDRQKQRSESAEPIEQAQRDQFRRDLRARAEQRGINLPSGPPR